MLFGVDPASWLSVGGESNSQFSSCLSNSGILVSPSLIDYMGDVLSSGEIHRIINQSFSNYFNKCNLTGWLFGT